MQLRVSAHGQPTRPNGDSPTLEDAFFFELCDCALGAPLRAPKILRELSDGGLRVIPKESERAGALRVRCTLWPRVRTYGFPDCFEHKLHETSHEPVAPERAKAS